mgnify:CR=1 FL=1
MASDEAEPNGERETLVAFDLPLRLFHWMLVLLVFCAWASFEYSEWLNDPVLKWHRWNGLALLTLLVWRLLWGVFGPRNARFTSFVPGPRTAIGYGRDLLAGNEAKYLGHNPLGSLMILALLAALLTQGSLGLFSEEHNGITAGPLFLFLDEAGRKAARSWHEFVFHRVLLVLIVIHVAANAFYSLVRGEPLIKAMVTGRKRIADYADAADTRRGGSDNSGSVLQALALLLLSAAIVGGGLWAVGGRFLRMAFW